MAVKDLLKLTGSTSIAQMLPILILPVISRLYSPSDFGVLAIFSAAYLLVGATSSLRYELALLVTNNRRERRTVLALCIILALVNSALGTAGIVLLSGIGWVKFEAGPFQLGLLFAASLFYSLQCVFTAWCNRQASYTRIAFSRIAQSGTLAFSPVILFYLVGSDGLLLAQVFALAAGTLIISPRPAWGRLNPRELQTYISSIASVAKKYAKNACYGLPHVFMDNAAALLLNALILRGFGEAALGLFSISLKFKMPLNAISGAFAMIHQKEIAGGNSKSSDILLRNRKQLKRVAAIATLFAPIFMVAPWLAGTFLGDEWVYAGVCAQALSPMIICAFFVACFGSTAYLMDAQRGAFLFGIIFHVSTISPFAGLTLASAPLSASLAEIFALSSILGALVLLFHLRWLLRLRPHGNDKLSY